MNGFLQSNSKFSIPYRYKEFKYIYNLILVFNLELINSFLIIINLFHHYREMKVVKPKVAIALVLLIFKK